MSGRELDTQLLLLCVSCANNAVVGEACASDVASEARAVLVQVGHASVGGAVCRQYHLAATA